MNSSTSGAGSCKGLQRTALERKVLELERTVQLLEEARSHYADHYSFAPYGSLTLSPSGCILELNLTAARMLGEERARMIGMPLLSYISKPSVRDFRHHLRQCNQRREKVVSEIGIGFREENLRLVEFLSMPVVDSTSGETVFRTVLFDITERRNVELALRQSENRFATAFHASPGPITLSTLKEGRYVDVNDAFCELIGEPRHEVIGRTSVDLGLYPDDPARDVYIEKLKKSRRIQNVESRISTKKGGERDLLISAELITLEGEECVLLIGQDVTELKRLQREVLEISDREQARIGQDLHDSACQSLSGIAILADVTARNLEREGSDSTGRVREIARLLRESVEEVRQLAGGLFPIKIERFGLAWALRDLAHETSARCHSKCTFIMRQPVRFEDQSAAIHLYRIAQEAVSNAVRHGRATHIAMELSACDDLIRLCISDDGCGLTGKPNEKGLGLHTMEYRAQMLGGKLELGTSDGKGTTVTCVFPGKNFAHVDNNTISQEEKGLSRRGSSGGPPGAEFVHRPGK